MTGNKVTCVLCDRQVPTDDLERSYRLRYFSDVVICPECLEGETYGHGQNATYIRSWLATSGDGRAPAGQR